MRTDGTVIDKTPDDRNQNDDAPHVLDAAEKKRLAISFLKRFVVTTSILLAISFIATKAFADVYAYPSEASCWRDVQDVEAGAERSSYTAKYVDVIEFHVEGTDPFYSTGLNCHAANPTYRELGDFSTEIVITAPISFGLGRMSIGVVRVIARRIPEAIFEKIKNVAVIIASPVVTEYVAKKAGWTTPSEIVVNLADGITAGNMRNPCSILLTSGLITGGGWGGGYGFGDSAYSECIQDMPERGDLPISDRIVLERPAPVRDRFIDGDDDPIEDPYTDEDEELEFLDWLEEEIEEDEDDQRPDEL